MMLGTRSSYVLLKNSFVGIALVLEFTIEFNHPNISLLSSFRHQTWHPFTRVVVKSSDLFLFIGLINLLMLHNLVIYLPSVPPLPHRQRCEERIFVCLISAEVQIRELYFYWLDLPSLPQVHHSSCAHLNGLL